MSEIYSNPLSSRYASEEMLTVFSEPRRIGLWRRLWLALAESEKELGLNITDEQLAEMRSNLDNIDFELAARREVEVRHDVMSHIYAFGECCPLAKPIIHLGATSCFVTDNSELIQMHDALVILEKRLRKIVKNLSDFALKYKSLPALGLTHGQAAQLTTVGKRATLYLQDFACDLRAVMALIKDFKLRGAKGTTGTQASFLELFEGDFGKVKALDQKVAEKMGFSAVFDVTGQTYTRKFDYTVLSVLSGIAQSASKYATDLRLLQAKKEMEEPFGKNQVGSSAMAYKRNPMMSERVCSLSRYLMTLPANSAFTQATQWFERTLDDSANRRIVNSQAFLSADAILIIVEKLTAGAVVYEKVIAKNIAEELPFMASENLLMEAVKAGGDRQILHEAIRKHAMDAAMNVKNEGGKNDFIERISGDNDFKPYLNCLGSALDASKYIGCAPMQTEEFVSKINTEFFGRN